MSLLLDGSPDPLCKGTASDPCLDLVGVPIVGFTPEREGSSQHFAPAIGLSQLVKVQPIYVHPCCVLSIRYSKDVAGPEVYVVGPVL